MLLKSGEFTNPSLESPVMKGVVLSIAIGSSGLAPVSCENMAQLYDVAISQDEATRNETYQSAELKMEEEEDEPNPPAVSKSGGK